MKLPVDEEHDEQMVRVPEALKVSTTAFLDCEEHHRAERGGHDPACCARASDKLSEKERRDALSSRLRICICDCEFRIIDHVCSDVHKREEDHGPGNRLMKRDILIERNDVVEGRATEKRYEVAADREQDKNNIYV